MHESDKHHISSAEGGTEWGPPGDTGFALYIA